MKVYMKIDECWYPKSLLRKFVTFNENIFLVQFETCIIKISIYWHNYQPPCKQDTPSVETHWLNPTRDYAKAAVDSPAAAGVVKW